MQLDMGTPNYSEVPLPDDKPRSEYSYVERRAAILTIIEKRGHPWGLNKSQLGREFGVSDAQIHKDLDRLKDWYSNLIGEDARTASDLAYRRIVQEHMDNGDFEKARRALDSWNAWLEDRGYEDKEADALELQGGEDIGANAGLSPDDKEQLDALLDS